MIRKDMLRKEVSEDWTSFLKARASELEYEPDVTWLLA